MLNKTMSKKEAMLRREMLNAKRDMFSARCCFDYATDKNDIDRCIFIMQSCSERYSELYERLKRLLC